jgi:hypothetical protein
MLAPSLGGLLLLAAVVCGLLAMHGLQPSPGPVSAPSVFALNIGYAGGTAMPMSVDGGHDSGQTSPHDGHGGGQVCLAFLLAGAVLLLLLMTAGQRSSQLSIRFNWQALPRTPTARPRGPTLAQLSVLRL